MDHRIIKITEAPDMIDTLASWFHDKWGIDKSAYLESMRDAINGSVAFPEWYAVVSASEIIGGAGVIENDFHNRPDLSPNLCALYVVPEHRGRGIAGELLEYISLDMNSRGVNTLYLVTDHTSFYERYGWEYYCNVRSSGENSDSRLYVKKSNGDK